MKSKDPDYIAKLEKAIADKYGKETIAHPKADWDDEKEMEYLNELKTNYRSLNEEQEKEKLVSLSQNGHRVILMAIQT